MKWEKDDFFIIFKAVRHEVFSNKQSNYFVATKVFFRRGPQNTSFRFQVFPEEDKSINGFLI